MPRIAELFVEAVKKPLLARPCDTFCQGDGTIASYKPEDHNSRMLPVIPSEQIIPGSFALALNYPDDH